MAFPDDYKWKYKRPIDASNIDATLSSFPVMVLLADVPTSMMDAGAESCLNGGGDIRSGNEDGSTQYPLEVVRCVTSATAGNRKLELHIQVPSVSSSVNTDVWIFYKNAGDSPPAADSTYGSENVWDSDFVIVSHDGGATNSVDSSSGTEQGSMSTGSGPEPGQVAADFGNHTQNNGWLYTGFSDFTQFTIEAMCYFDDVEGNDSFVGLVHNSAFSQVPALYTYNATSDPAVWTLNNPFNIEYLNGGHPTATEWLSCGATWDGSTARQIFHNGVVVASDNPSTGLPSGLTRYTMGRTGDSTNNMSGLQGEHRVSKNIRSAAWMKATDVNLRDHSNFFGSASTPELVAGTSVSVSPDTGTVSLTGLAPTAVALSPFNETPSQAMVSLSGYAPTAVAINPVAVTPDAGTVALSGYAPVVVAISPVAATPDKADITLTGYSPAAVAINPVNETPDSGAISISGYNPAVIAISPVNETPDIANIGISGFGPAVIAIDPVAETPAQAVITLSGYSPAAVAINPVAETPDTATISINGIAPSVSTSNFIEAVPGTGNIGISGYAPTVAALSPIGTTPDAGLIALSGYAPGVFASNHITASPDVGQIDITGHAPTVEALSPISESPGVAGIGLNGLAPIVTALNAVSVIPGIAVIEIAGYFPDINISDHIAVYPDPASISIIGLAPTVSTVSFIPNSKRTYTVGANSRTATAGPSNRQFTIN